MRVIAFLLLLGLVGCHDIDWMQYRWDDRRILCSQPFDDLQRAPKWDEIERQLAMAQHGAAVTFVHAHTPGLTVTPAAVERVLNVADKLGLAYVTFPELVPGPARGGVAIAFDDQGVEQWMQIRDLLKRHRARVTFFVSRLNQLVPEQLAMIKQLADDGHAIEAHSVNHLDVEVFVAKSGVQAYLDEEARPSISGLRALGYTVTSYAYPFGTSNDAVNDLLLRDVARIRVGTGACPY